MRPEQEPTILPNRRTKHMKARVHVMLKNMLSVPILRTEPYHVHRKNSETFFHVFRLMDPIVTERTYKGT